MTAKVSVLVTTFNRAGMLDRALRSVAAQTFSGFECIVVNDHPGTAAEVTKVVAGLGDKRFRLVHNEANAGPAASRNRAISLANSPVLALLDDDDSWKPQFLASHQNAHTEHPEVFVAYCGYERDRSAFGLGPKPMPALPSPPDIFTEMLSGRFTFASTSIVSVKRDAAVAVGGYDENLKGFEDWDLACRLVRLGSAVAIPEILTISTEHAGYRLSRLSDDLEPLLTKWAEYPEIKEFVGRYAAEREFNRSRDAALSGERLAGWRHLARYLSKARNDLDPWRSVARLLFLNVFGRQVYVRLQRIYDLDPDASMPAARHSSQVLSPAHLKGNGFEPRE